MKLRKWIHTASGNFKESIAASSRLHINQACLLGGAVIGILGWKLVVKVNAGTISMGNALSDMLLLSSGACVSLAGLALFIAWVVGLITQSRNK